MLRALLLGVVLVCLTHAHSHSLGHDVIGEGYDILYGNPDTRKDPGQRAAAFSFSYSQGKKTPDGRHTIPNCVSATNFQDGDCNFEGDVRTFVGETSYQAALSSEAVATDEMSWPGRFSLSAGWKAATNHSNFASITTSVLVRCPIYNVSVDLSTVTLSSAFKTAVGAIPESGGSAAAFVKQFGTHYVKQVVFGSKTILQDTFAEWDYTRLENSVDIAYAAQANFNASLLGKPANSQGNTFESYISSQEAIRFGVPVPANSPSNTWRLRSTFNPVPISYQLGPITDLLTPLYFPHMHPNDIALREAAVSSYLKSYCKSSPGCAAPTPDSPPLNVTVVVSSGTTAIAKCPTGMHLASCGFNVPAHRRGFYPEKQVYPQSGQCHCYDANYPIRCYALCYSKPLPGYQVIQRQVGTHVASPAVITCPAGKVLVGCTASLFGLSFEDPHYYPYNSGTACYCQGRGIRCYATCAYKSHLQNYEVVKSSYALGKTTAKCTGAGASLLGCGYSAHSQSVSLATSMYMYPDYDSNSCSCYNQHGSYCYATCARVL